MKHWLTAALICFGAITAKADTGVFSTQFDSCTFTTVLVSSAVLPGATGTNKLFAASLVGATTTFLTLQEGRKYLALSNPDASASIIVQVTLSSTSANGDLALTIPSSLSTTAGLLIAPSKTEVIPINPRNSSNGRVNVLWGVNNSGSANKNLTITQCR